MAHILTPKESYAIMNELVHQATGQSNITVVDTSSFVAAGETTLNTGVENTLSALALILGRIMVSVRPYKAKLMIIQALNTGMYTDRMAKISYYSRDNQPAGFVNTDQKTNFADGYTNGDNNNASTKSMWEQNAPVPLQMFFSGSDVWDTSTTLYEVQLKKAFRNEQEFGRFVGGIMTEKANDIESTKEAFNRMTMLNHMAGIYDLKASMPGSAVNLTKAYNDKFGTSHTSAELRTTYLDEFLKFFVAEFKLASDFMTERSARYHWTPTKAGHVLLRTTPKANQRAVLFNPLLVDAQAQVLPSIFNDEYLKVENFEPVNYWQSVNDRAMINITPAIPNVNNPATQTAGAAVNIYVVGMLFDQDAIMTDFQYESSATTPLEARKLYRNVFWHFSKNAINDFTENAILFYMEDEA